MSAEAEVLYYTVLQYIECEYKLEIAKQALKKAKLRNALFVGIAISAGIVAVREIDKSKRRIEALEKELKKAGESKDSEALI